MLLGSNLSLAHVQLHGVLLLPPMSPSVTVGDSLVMPLLANTGRHPSGQLQLERCTIVTLCSTLKQWTDRHAASSSSQAQGNDSWIAVSMFHTVCAVMMPPRVAHANLALQGFWVVGFRILAPHANLAL